MGSSPATQPPLRFRGSPQLLEGLAPFPYKEILAGATVRVSLSTAESQGPPPSEVQTAPAGASATLVRFSLPPGTAAGSYRGDVSFGASTYPIVVEVEGRAELHVSPSRLTLTGTKGTTVTVEMTAANAGNVTADIPSAGAFGLFDVQGAERSIGEAFREPAGKGQDRVSRLFDRMAEEHGGMVRVQVTQGGGPLKPGEFRNLQLQVRLPDSIKPAHTYSGTCPLGSLRLYVRVEVPAQVVSKEVQ